jgi:site-specific DNA-methyltransferase (adenine-specific)
VSFLENQKIVNYLLGDTIGPLFILGDIFEEIRQFPTHSIDCCVTSPPYWSKRVYSGGGIGLEASPTEYIERLFSLFLELKRVVKPSGSVWLNISDTYVNKGLKGIPWRLAIRLMDEQGWVIRNCVVWNKVKGGLDNTGDKLRNVYEFVFHFVMSSQGYFYDVDAIRSTPSRAKIVNGSVVSATGVRGVRYKRQIELSMSLSESEKRSAMRALEDTLDEVRRGELSDFRLVLRGHQRATHSDQSLVSGRAKELQQKGYYILRYHPRGSKPSDVWDIIPEDTSRGDSHFAVYPEDLCKIPILATCPTDGVVLDPFCGTGTTNLVARSFERKSIGIDISKDYIKIAENRCMLLV